MRSGNNGIDTIRNVYDWSKGFVTVMVRFYVIFGRHTRISDNITNIKSYYDFCFSVNVSMSVNIFPCDIHIGLA